MRNGKFSFKLGKKNLRSISKLENLNFIQIRTFLGIVLQIIGIGSEKVHVAFSFDSIGAIDHAFQMTGSLLVHYFQKLYDFNWLKPEDLLFPPTIKLEELSKNEIRLQKNLKKHNVQIQYKNLSE
ncbi:hypothetical protein LEP1GSC065_4172 [Leptospira kirschneri serovar Sokoine str. RM1]|nr:hypothetical protein LEP1GSC065_4172 [Leptospira kirschneri serovar Sokoine str. RM1]